MATIKISAGPRYQKTGSPTQKKDRKLREIMALIMNDALFSAGKKSEAQSLLDSQEDREV
jgi:hypothetical protein